MGTERNAENRVNDALRVGIVLRQESKIQRYSCTPRLLPSPDIRHNPRYVYVFQRGCAEAITQAALPTACIDLFKRRVL